MNYLLLYNGVRIVDAPCPANVMRIDMGAMPMVEEMHRRGIRVDVPYLRDLDGKLAARQRDIELDIDGLVGSDYPGFMPSSPDQVAILLFGKMGLVPPGKLRRVKSGRVSTEDEVLSSMVAMHPVVGKILDHREVAKLRSTYTGPIPTMVRADGRLYTIFKMTRTDTGRLACGDRKQGYCNLQNIAVRGEWGPLVRNGFIASPGMRLLSVDLRQIEMRLAAYMSVDSAMTGIFLNGLDIHNRTACALFKLDIERIDYLAARDDAGTLEGEEAAEWKNFKRTQRAPSKNLGFGILYGLTAQGLQANIMAEGGPKIEVEECQRYIDEWFRAYPGIKTWMELQYQRARMTGMVWTLFGRTRRIPGVMSMARDLVSEADRQAGNMPIQGTAGDLLKLIMAEMIPIVEYYGSFPSVRLWPLLQVHDELIFECSPDIVDDFAHETRFVMQNVLRGQLGPVDSSADIGERWGSLK